MDIIRTYQYNGLDAFQIILDCNFKFGHTIKSTIPIEYLKETQSKYLEKIRNAYVPFEREGAEILNELAKRILMDKFASNFFFPEFLLRNGIVSMEIIKQIYKLHEIFFSWPRTHYCPDSFPVDFFVMTCWYYAKKNSILKNAKEIDISEFEDYLMSVDMKIDYARIKHPGNRAISLVEEDKSEFMLLINKIDQLIMVISL